MPKEIRSIEQNLREIAEAPIGYLLFGDTGRNPLKGRERTRRRRGGLRLWFLPLYFWEYWGCNYLPREKAGGPEERESTVLSTAG
jgi:hypothetical protein